MKQKKWTKREEKFMEKHYKLENKIMKEYGYG